MIGAVLPDVLEPILRGDADVTLGSRMLDGATRRGMPRYKWLGNRAPLGAAAA